MFSTWVTLSGPSPIPGEGDTATYTVTYFWDQALAPGGTVTIGYGGSATPGQDYEIPTTSVTIPANPNFYPGGGSIQFYVPIKADNRIEDPETLIVSISSDSEGLILKPYNFPPYLDPTPYIQSTITIPDNPPIVSIADGDTMAMENAEGDEPDPGSVVVSRTGGNINEALTVVLTARSSSTATYGQDYVLGSAVIPAGEALQVVSLTVLDDPDAEGIETAEIVVAACPGVYLQADPAATQPAVVRIDDNVSVRSIAVDAVDIVQAFDRYTFSVSVEVIGEGLNRARIRQLVQGSTSMKDYTGHSLTRAEIDAYFWFNRPDPNVFYPQGGWVLDTGWDWKPLTVVEGTKNGMAVMAEADMQGLILSSDQVNLPEGGQTLTSYLAHVTRYFRLEVARQGTTSVLGSLEWGYKWSNYNCEWTAAQGAPWTTCAAKFKGQGEFFDVQAIDL